MNKTKHSVDTIKVQSAKIAMKNLLSKIPSSCSFNFTAHNALFVQTFQAMTGKTPLRADWAATHHNPPLLMMLVTSPIFGLWQHCFVDLNQLLISCKPSGAFMRNLITLIISSSSTNVDR